MAYDGQSAGSGFLRFLAHLGLGLWLATFVLFSLVGLVILGYQNHYSLRIFEGISVLGVDVGGLKPEEAREELRRLVDEQGYPYIRLHLVEQEWRLCTHDLGGRLDVDQAVFDAWRIGRSGVFRDDLRARLLALWWGYEIVPQFTLDPGPALVYLRQVARQAGHPARTASLWVSGLQARTDQSRVGQEMDIVATHQAIEQAVREWLGASHWRYAPLWQRLVDGRRDTVRVAVEPIPVRVLFREIVPPLTAIEGAEERVALMLSAPIQLLAELPELQADGLPQTVVRPYLIDQAELGSWLTVETVAQDEGREMQVELDAAKVREWLRPLAEDLARAPREPAFDYDPETGALTTLAPGQYGYALDLEAATDLVMAASLSDSRIVRLPVLVIEPRVTREKLEQLLPLELISEGESSFQGSRSGRLQNIKVAAAQFDGAVVPPHATFSFLQHLGPVSAAQGYTDSWIIYGDRTVLGPGGGVCQVSTTCFRAAFFGGYPIVLRRPHAYRVGWYEPPVGLDAAVYSPSADFRFENDQDTPIVIVTTVDEVAERLIFRFYGRALARKVAIEGPEVGESVDPGEPVYEVDETLATGTTILVEGAHPGVDVVLYRIITEPGHEDIREAFESAYEPWPARYRIGPAKPKDPTSPGAGASP